VRVLEFQTQLNPDHTLTVPLAVAQQIQGEEALRVVVFVPDAAENQSWAGLAAEQFLSGYSELDETIPSHARPDCPRN
jgi:hypothetical protein